MKAKHDRRGDAKAVTVALKDTELVTGSSYGDVPWGEWCYREMGRMNASGDGGKVRVARGGGLMWLTRG